MASFSVPCQKTTTIITASQLNEKMNQQQHQQQQLCSVSFQWSSPALLAGSSLRFRGSRHNQSDDFKVFSQLNDKSSNSVPVSDTKSGEPVNESAAQDTVPDSASISAFMTQVADIVELVDSRDITELQLKQLGCELIIRKKEALQQQSVASPIVMTQPPSPQAMVPSQLLPAPVSASASAGPVSSPLASGLVPPTPGKPKSSHPPLKCPMAGTFYLSPAPGVPPFVKVGDKVQKGQVVCIIEAMKLMNEIEADQSGTVVEILVDDAKQVSVDTPLFVIEP